MRPGRNRPERDEMETKAFDEGTCIAQLMGFTKDELRDLSAAMGLPVAAFWSKDRICRAMVQAMGENLSLIHI